MNDRFKFRIYDLEQKHYLRVIQDETTNAEGFAAFYGEYNNICKPMSFFLCHNIDRWVIEQCTGLKDKNGNLIYEGDIVRYSYGRKGIVSFGKYTGCFAAGWENIYVDLFGWYLDDYYDPDNCGRLRINLDNTHDSITEEDAGDFEIISNIHNEAEQKEQQ